MNTINKKQDKRREKKFLIRHHLPVNISQHLDIGKSGYARLPDGQGLCEGDGCNEFWAKRVCGPASLAMIVIYCVSKKDPNVVKAIKKLLKDSKIISSVNDANWISNETNKLNELLDEHDSVKWYSILYHLERAWPTKNVDEDKMKKLSEFLVDFIISDGVKNKAYVENIGWLHQGLIDAAVKHFGLRGNRFDFAKEETETAFERMIEELKNGPVIASIYKNLNPQNGGHLVVIFGIDGDIVLFADPDINNPNLIERKATTEEFKKGWKKRFIVIKPK